MKREEKIKKAKAKLIKAKEIVRKIKADYYAINELRLSLMGTVLDYSKDRVQTTPENAMEKVMANIEEHEQSIARNQMILASIHHSMIVLDERHREVLTNIYLRDLSVNATAERMHCSVRSINYIRNDALEMYYEKILNKNIK